MHAEPGTLQDPEPAAELQRVGGRPAERLAAVSWTQRIRSELEGQRGREPLVAQQHVERVEGQGVGRAGERQDRRNVVGAETRARQ